MGSKIINLFKLEKDINMDNKIEYSGSIIKPVGDYEFQLFVKQPNEKDISNWNWIAQEFDFDTVMVNKYPSGILMIYKEDKIYAVSFGNAFFTIDRYCDYNFAFEFAKRIDYKTVNTSALIVPQSRKNRVINTYTNYSYLDYDSGESYSKLKIHLLDESEIYGNTVEIGTSIKFSLKMDSLEGIAKLIDFVECVLDKPEKNKIPLFISIKDMDEIEKLNAELKNKIKEEDGYFDVSELDIIGTEEIFNKVDNQYKVICRGKYDTISEISNEQLYSFCREKKIELDDLIFQGKIKYIENGWDEQIYKLLNYTNEKERAVLLRGKWYRYNEEYVSLLNDSVDSIETVYNPKYDFSRSQKINFVKQLIETEKKKLNSNLESIESNDEKIKKKYYREYVFNLLREQEGFKLCDRNLKIVEDKSKIEMMDLYDEKNKIMIAVKIGKGSAELSYIVDQSLISLKEYRNRYSEDNKNEYPEAKCFALWIILDRATKLKVYENNVVQLSELNMIILKNKLNEWQKELKNYGMQAKVFINYYDDEKNKK